MATASDGTVSNSASIPLSVDAQKQLVYNNEIYGMFTSTEFGEATPAARREIVGTAIYKHISAMVGEEHAPKVTGMIIDLEPHELNMSIRHYPDLQMKVSSAMQLLMNNMMIPSAAAAASGEGESGADLGK